MIKIVVWDNIGNVLLGMRLGKATDTYALTDDDPAAVEGAPTFEEAFADYEIELHQIHKLEELEPLIEDTDFLVIHKERVPAEILAKGKKLRLVQHLGQRVAFQTRPLRSVLATRLHRQDARVLLGNRGQAINEATEKRRNGVAQRDEILRGRGRYRGRDARDPLTQDQLFIAT